MKPDRNMMHLWRMLKHRLTSHHQGPDKNIFIFSTARSGTTWLAEILATQGRFKIVNEPFNLRVPVKREHLGITDWNDLFKEESRPLIQRYVNSFINGSDSDPRYQRHAPFTPGWHYTTDRIIFKILFAGEDSINWFRDLFNGQVILLIRHPIPVALSRNQFPRLNSFLQTRYAENFSSSQLDYAQAVLASGDKLQIAVLDWCLQNVVPVRDIDPDWIVISYEQLVLQPDLMVKYLAERLSFPAVDKMMRQVFKASGSTSHSAADSRQILLDPERIRKNREKLIARWRKSIGVTEEARVFETLKVLGVDCYEYGSDTPTEKYWIQAGSG